MDDIRLYALVGLLLGITFSLLFYFWYDPKKILVDKLVRANRLHALRFAAQMSSMLQEKELLEAYRLLHASGDQFRLRQWKEGMNKQEAEEVEAELLRLENYLSVLETICFAVGERVFEQENILGGLANRLHDLHRHPDVCRYLEEYARFYPNLIREMKKEIR